MYLAIKEIKHEKLRYGMIIAMIALISWLIFILTGLAQGLGNQNTAAIDSWNFKSIALNKDADVNLRQSIFDHIRTNQRPAFNQKRNAAWTGIRRSQAQKDEKYECQLHRT